MSTWQAARVAELYNRFYKEVPDFVSCITASDKQMSFIERLISEREGTNEANLARYTVDQAMAGLEDIDTKRASKIIDMLIAVKPVAKAVTTEAQAPSMAAPVAFDGSALPSQGIYTVVGPKGGHRTLRFHTAKSGYFAGKVVVDYLSGPNNETDYRGFANLDGNQQVRVWKRYAEATDIIAALKFLARGADSQAEAGKAYAVASGCCYRCGRTLTTPESVAAGIGPECSKKI